MLKTIDPESSLAKKYGIHVIAYHVMKGETPVEIFNYQLKFRRFADFENKLENNLSPRFCYTNESLLSGVL